MRLILLILICFFVFRKSSKDVKQQYNDYEYHYHDKNTEHTLEGVHYSLSKYFGIFFSHKA